MTFVEIDRCATDAIAVVTGCRLGKRALKFRDFGKMAATFCDLRDEKGRSSRQRWNRPRIARRELYPHIEKKNEQQMLAYREMPDDDLFCDAVGSRAKSDRRRCRDTKPRESFATNVAKASTSSAKYVSQDGHYAKLRRRALLRSAVSACDKSTSRIGWVAPIFSTAWSERRTVVSNTSRFGKRISPDRELLYLVDSACDH